MYFKRTTLKRAQPAVSSYPTVEEWFIISGP